MSEQVDPRENLAATLGRVPSGLFVLTATQGENETGLLASWVQQCSFEPPQVTVAVKRDRPVARWLTPDTLFALNILAEGQNSLVSHFARGFALGDPAFAGLAVLREEGKPPVLADALGYLMCRVAGRLEAGDHDVFVGTVQAGWLLGDGKPWVHVRKNGLRY